MVEVCAGRTSGLVFRPNPELCYFGMQSLVSTAEAALAVGETSICIDLSETTLLSGSAVGFLLDLAARCEAAGGRLCVEGAHGLPAQVLRILGADHLVGEDDPRTARPTPLP